MQDIGGPKGANAVVRLPTAVLPSPTLEPKPPCETCTEDLAFLRSAKRPAYEAAARPVRLVDLFCGGGGLSLGVAEAARRAGRGLDVRLAVEMDDLAADVYARNFPKADLRRADISTLFGGDIGAAPTVAERRLADSVGHVDVLVAGPPCQGHSDLNNHTRREDPRNALYLRAVRAVEVLHPSYVLIENVPAVRHDKGDVVGVALHSLRSRAYRVAEAVLDLREFGIPQRRRRHLLLAASGDRPNPAEALRARPQCSEHDPRSVRWAIGDLAEVAADSGPDAPSRATPENRERMLWLHAAPDRVDLPNEMRPACHRDKAHSYVSMYGRLSWDEPAQTITTGFGSMGQGRFVHPGLPRTITPHEAARLQTLPDFWDVGATERRGAWAAVIGNAVPPLLAVHLVGPLVAGSHGPEDPGPGPGDGEPAVARHNAEHVPAASSESIRARMRTTKRRDTRPELALRSALHKMGLRFWVDRAIGGSRGKADILFPTERVAVYVDGCFWHSCPDHGTTPVANREWWTAKLAANRTRDADTTAALTREGWLVLRFWEHEDAHAAARVVFSRVQEIRALSGQKARGGE